MLSDQSQIVSSLSTENTSPLILTRNVNFKTPARSLKRGRVVHNENSVYGHPKTTGFTGRKKNNVLFSTPLNGPSKPGLTTDKGLRFKSTALAEITNQTPFTTTLVPVTPALLKSSKSFAIFNDDVVPSTRRISSTRKKLRLPRPASNKFETPETKGNYWDVSDASIEGSVIEDVSITEEDYDDIEYAPPTAIESQFDPGFDMPDYKKVGATFMSLFRQTTIPNDHDHDPVWYFDGADLLEDIGPIVWERLELPDISPDDIFPLTTQSESAQTSITAARLQRVESSHSKSTEVRSAMPPKSGLPRPSVTTYSSKPLTGKIMHTRIPSISRPKVAQAVTQTTRLDSKATSSGHARTTIATHTRTVGVASKNTGMTDLKTASISSTNGLSKLRRFVPSTEPKHRTKTQQIVPDDDTVLSLLTDFKNEPLGEEFLFTV